MNSNHKKSRSKSRYRLWLNVNFAKSSVSLDLSRQKANLQKLHDFALEEQIARALDRYEHRQELSSSQISLSCTVPTNEKLIEENSVFLEEDDKNIRVADNAARKISQIDLESNDSDDAVTYKSIRPRSPLQSKRERVSFKDLYAEQDDENESEFMRPSSSWQRQMAKSLEEKQIMMGIEKRAKAFIRKKGYLLIEKLNSSAPGILNK
jgi:hypothetical protein